MAYYYDNKSCDIGEGEKKIVIYFVITQYAINRIYNTDKEVEKSDA